MEEADAVEETWKGPECEEKVDSSEHGETEGPECEEKEDSSVHCVFGSIWS